MEGKIIVRATTILMGTSEGGVRVVVALPVQRLGGGTVHDDRGAKGGQRMISSGGTACLVPTPNYSPIRKLRSTKEELQEQEEIEEDARRDAFRAVGNELREAEETSNVRAGLEDAERVVNRDMRRTYMLGRQPTVLMDDAYVMRMAIAARKQVDRGWHEHQAAQARQRAEEAHAALRIQSNYRALPARRQHQQVRKERSQAATKLQARQRGALGRNRAQTTATSKRQQEVLSAAMDAQEKTRQAQLDEQSQKASRQRENAADADVDLAAARVQAGYRGQRGRRTAASKSTRAREEKEKEKEKEKEARNAAVRLQASRRGQAARREVAAQKASSKSSVKSPAKPKPAMLPPKSQLKAPPPKQGATRLSPSEAAKEANESPSSKSKPAASATAAPQPPTASSSPAVPLSTAAGAAVIGADDSAPDAPFAPSTDVKPMAEKRPGAGAVAATTSQDSKPQSEEDAAVARSATEIVMTAAVTLDSEAPSEEDAAVARLVTEETITAAIEMDMVMTDASAAASTAEGPSSATPRKKPASGRASPTFQVMKSGRIELTLKAVEIMGEVQVMEMAATHVAGTKDKNDLASDERLGVMAREEQRRIATEQEELWSAADEVTEWIRRLSVRSSPRSSVRSMHG